MTVSHLATAHRLDHGRGLFENHRMRGDWAISCVQGQIMGACCAQAALPVLQNASNDEESRRITKEGWERRQWI